MLSMRSTSAMPTPIHPRLHNLVVEPFARLRCELLGIVDALRDTARVENDRRRDHRPRERTASRFVDAAGDRRAALEIRSLERVHADAGTSSHDFDYGGIRCVDEVRKKDFPPKPTGAVWLLRNCLPTRHVLIRTILEDATLHRELSGYAEFASRTRSQIDSRNLVAHAWRACALEASADDVANLFTT